jgi:hypothetical protein
MLQFVQQSYFKAQFMSKMLYSVQDFHKNHWDICGGSHKAKKRAQRTRLLRN